MVFKNKSISSNPKKYLYQIFFLNLDSDGEEYGQLNSNNNNNNSSSNNNNINNKKSTIVQLNLTSSQASLQSASSSQPEIHPFSKVNNSKAHFTCSNVIVCFKSHKLIF